MTAHDQPKESILQTIGETPLIALDDTPENVDVYAKLETFNPGGSVKDRIGKHILERLLERGDISPGDTIIEPTAGNTGIGMAIAATALDLEVIVVIPRGFSQEKTALMRALGADVVHISTDADMGEAAEIAHELADDRSDAFVPQQFATPLNVEAHYETTGQELLDALGTDIGALVVGIGSGGTLMGTAKAVSERIPELLVIGVEPAGSVFGELLGEQRSAGPYKTEGIGTHDPEVTTLLEPEQIDDIISVSDEAAHAEVQRLAKDAGHLVGSSAGAASVAARTVAEDIASGERSAPAQTVVTVFPDGSDRYLSKGIYGSFEKWEGKQ